MEQKKGFKGFNRNLECRDYVYSKENESINSFMKPFKIGKSYTYDFAELYKSGFHFSENLLCEFAAVSPCGNGEINRFCEVKAGGEIKHSRNNTLSACSEVKIVKEIKETNLAHTAFRNLLDLINNGLKESETAYKSPVTKRGMLTYVDGFYSVSSDTGNNTKVEVIGLHSIAANTGFDAEAITKSDCSISAATGESSASICEGDNSVSVSTKGCSASFGKGESSIAATTCPFSVAVNEGKASAALSSGHNSLVSTSGFSSLAAGTGRNSLVSGTGRYSASVVMGGSSCAISHGEKSVSLATGERSSASVDGNNSIAIATGEGGKAKGIMGSWLVLTEIERQDNGVCIVKEVKAFKIDGEKIKPDTFYILKNGEAVKTE